MSYRSPQRENITIRFEATDDDPGLHAKIFDDLLLVFDTVTGGKNAKYALRCTAAMRFTVFRIEINYIIAEGEADMVDSFGHDAGFDASLEE